MIQKNDKTIKISAIIPAFNEEKNIIKVLIPLKRVEAIKEIIVISDGSTDDTVKLVRKFGNAKVISLPYNVGKTKAVTRGVIEAENPTILFCDADLINLNEKHLSDLITKYCEGFEMVIMDKGSQPWIFRSVLKSVPAVSGTRILDKELFFKIPFKDSDRFQLEIRINDYILEHSLPFAVTSAEEIYDLRKFVKYHFLEGLILDLKGGLEVLASDGLPSVFKNLATFRKIKKLSDPSK